MYLAKAVVPAVAPEYVSESAPVPVVTPEATARITGVNATSATAATTAATKTESKAAMMVMVTPSINQVCVCCNITAKHYCRKCCYN